MFGLSQKRSEEEKPSDDSKDSTGIAKIKALKGIMSIEAFRTLVLQIREYKANKDKELHEPKFIAILDSDQYLKRNRKHLPFDLVINSLITIKK